MISDELIQSDLITKLKSITSVIAIIGANEVKELQWQGDTFTYPNIRLDIESNDYEFDEQERCGLYAVEFSIFIFSQERSSKQCSVIKGLLENSLTGIGFTGANAKYNRLRLIDNVPAIREDSRTWRSQLKYRTRLTSI